jgi:hypothetical protein
VSDFQQIQISASSRGIVDHFFCFTCDEYVWDCDHLIEEWLSLQHDPLDAENRQQPGTKVAEGHQVLHQSTDVLIELKQQALAYFFPETQ